MPSLERDIVTWEGRAPSFLELSSEGVTIFEQEDYEGRGRIVCEGVRLDLVM